MKAESVDKAEKERGGELRFIAVDYRECKADYIAFRNANREAPRDEAYFEWRFLKKPGGCPPLVVWCLGPRGEKVGSVGFTRDIYMVDGKELPFGQLCDISISKDFRGRGIANRMLDFLAAQDVFREKCLSFAMPNRDASRALEKSGWTALANLERHVKVLRADSIIEKKLGRNIASSALSALVNSGLKVSSVEMFRKVPGHLKAVQLDSFDRRFDAFWEEYDKKGAVLGLRTSEYLSWRYGAHPYVDYRIYALLDGKRMLGYIVYFYDGEHCHMEDMLALDGDHTAVLLSSFIGFARQDPRAATLVIKTNANSVNLAPLKKFGFMKREDTQRFMTRVAEGSQALLSDASRWFLTSGDKDV